MAYKLKWEESGVIATFSGAFTFQENNRAGIEIFNDPRSDDLCYIIWDLSGITTQLITKSESQSLAMIDKMISSRLKQVKMAFVTTDETIRSICGQYAIHAINLNIPWEFQAFDNLEKAIISCSS